jgi:hypothetical protein
MSTDEIAMRKALGLIEGGIYVWKCPPPKDPQYHSFQSIAECVVEAKSLGLIYDLHIERSSAPHNLMHVVVLKVHGGLTLKGKRRLATLSKIQDTTESPAPFEPEIVILQPNFYGVGVNLKALWSRLKSRLSK